MTHDDNPGQSQADAETREKIDGYLTRSGLASRSPRVLPLTGDASDRRYFRVFLPDSGSIVLSLHSAPFEFEKLPFVNVARLLSAMPVPIPGVLGHADDLGVLALADLETSRCRHTSARRARRSMRRSTVKPSR